MTQKFVAEYELMHCLCLDKDSDGCGGGDDQVWKWDGVEWYAIVAALRWPAQNHTATFFPRNTILLYCKANTDHSVCLLVSKLLQ